MNVVDFDNMPEFSMDWTEGSLEGERILKLSGPFTLTGVFDFQDIIRSHHPSITIVDVTGVPYMDSAALGAILGLHVSCQKDARRYGLIGVAERLRTLFRVSGVDSMLITFGSLAEAEAALGGKAATA